MKEKEKEKDNNFKEFTKISKWNKIIALFGVFLALILSGVTIGYRLYQYNPKEPIIDKTIITNDKTTTDTACCMWQNTAKSTPTMISETDYYNTDNILLSISILAFTILSLWGTFTALFKVLKSENEITSKILDIEKDIYKERQMWELTKERKQQENDEYNRENGLKFNELKYKIEEFNDFEKNKVKLKNDHELNLKSLELQSKTEQNNNNIKNEQKLQDKHSESN